MAKNAVPVGWFERANEQRYECLVNAFKILYVFAYPSCVPKEMTALSKIERRLKKVYKPGRLTKKLAK